MKNSEHHVEYLFLIRSIEEFKDDLLKLRELMESKIFLEEEALEVMSYLTATKEIIEALEREYIMALSQITLKTI